MRNNSAIPAIANQPLSELELRLADGTPWTLSVSPEMERFIGRYPRLPGIAPAGELLTFREAPVRA